MAPTGAIHRVDGLLGLGQPGIDHSRTAKTLSDLFLHLRGAAGVSAA
jgi:hypothetical protein